MRLNCQRKIQKICLEFLPGQVESGVGQARRDSGWRPAMLGDIGLLHLRFSVKLRAMKKKSSQSAKQNSMRPFSSILVDGPERAAARAMLYPVGFKPCFSIAATSR